MQSTSAQRDLKLSFADVTSDPASALEALCASAGTRMTPTMSLLITHTSPPEHLSEAVLYLRSVVDESSTAAQRADAAIQASRRLKVFIDGEEATKVHGALSAVALHLNPTCGMYARAIHEIENANTTCCIDKSDLLVTVRSIGEESKRAQREFVLKLAVLWREVIELAQCTSQEDMRDWSRADAAMVVESIRCYYALVVHSSEPGDMRSQTDHVHAVRNSKPGLVSFLNVGLPLWRRVQSHLSESSGHPDRPGSNQWAVRRQAALWNHLTASLNDDDELGLEEPKFTGLVSEGKAGDQDDWVDVDAVVPVPKTVRGTETVTDHSTLQVVHGPLPKSFGREEADLLKQFAPLVEERMPVATMPPQSVIETIVSTLAAEYPWAHGAVDQIAELLKLRSLMGCRELVLPPLLLVGPPGTGKSRLARRLAELLSLPFVNIAMGGSNDVKMLTGTARGWGGATPSPLLTEMLQTRSASALVLLDEVDKCGRSGYTASGSELTNVLLGLLEPETASRYRDGFLQGRCDLSKLSYVATANSLRVSKPLMSRFMILHVPEPRPQDRQGLAQSMLGDLAAEMGVPREAMPEVPADIAQMFSGNARTLRAALRRFMLDWAEETLAPARLH